MLNNMEHKQRINATTLIEVILYMFLLGAMIMTVGGFIREILSAKNKQAAVMEVENDARHVLNTLEIDLKAASTVTAPASGGTAGTTLTMTFTNNGSITSRTYTFSGTTVMQSTNGAAAVAISSNRVQYTNFAVTHVSTAAPYHVVTVYFRANFINASGVGDKTYQKAFHTSVMLRPNL
jgi:hypothetical protein